MGTDNSAVLPRKSHDLMIVGGLALLALMLVQVLAPGHPLRQILTPPLVFLLPGYALSEALLIRREFDLASKFLISLGLSMATAIYGGLIINQTPWRINADTFSVFLTATTLIAVLVAYKRRQEMQMPAPTHQIVPMNLIGTQMIVIAVGILVAATFVSMITQALQHQENFTQLWLEPCREEGCTTVTVGVRSFEYEDRSYRLYVRTGPDEDDATWYDIDLAHEETWERPIELLNPRNGGYDINADLYVMDDLETPYREVFLRPGTLRG